ncbi:MAG TPA: hypothetical protein V6C84_00715 [Coleofasciculaceae cyanobacterium]|jgi:hypothetical protein
MNFNLFVCTVIVSSITTIGIAFGVLPTLRPTAPDASTRPSDAQTTAIAPPSVLPSLSPLPASPSPLPPASPQVVAESLTPQILRVTPEQTVRGYFSLLTDYQFEQARQYLAPGWNVSAEQFRRNWMKYERGGLRIIQMGKSTQLPNNQVSIAFTWRGQTKDGQDYGESWRCVLMPYGDSYLFDRCGSVNE